MATIMTMTVTMIDLTYLADLSVTLQANIANIVNTSQQLQTQMISSLLFCISIQLSTRSNRIYKSPR